VKPQEQRNLAGEHENSALHASSFQVNLATVPVQRKSGTPGTIPNEETKRPNKTGLPENLKAGLEKLSGLDMSDVRVHYNSSQPAQVNALAYTQGIDIHIKPGQEKHLPHEGWHVVQQMQGRVKPTVQVKGVTINDDCALEQEANLMGGKVAAVRDLVDNRFAQEKGTVPQKENTYKIPTNQTLSRDLQPVVQRGGAEALKYGVGGAAMGAGVGALVGSFVPGLGTAIGAGVGGAIGGLVGAIQGARTRTELALVRAAKGGSGNKSWSCHMTVHNWLVEAGYASKNSFPAKDPQHYQNAFYVGAQTPVRVGGNFTDTPGKIIVMYDVATGKIMHSMVSLGSGLWTGHNNAGTFGNAAPFTGTVNVATFPPAWWEGVGNILYNQQSDLGARNDARLRIVWMNPSDIGATYQ
jgi:hypothetical protein